MEDVDTKEIGERGLCIEKRREILEKEQMGKKDLHQVLLSGIQLHLHLPPKLSVTLHIFHG